MIAKLISTPRPQVAFLKDRSSVVSAPAVTAQPGAGFAGSLLRLGSVLLLLALLTVLAVTALLPVVLLGMVLLLPALLPLLMVVGSLVAREDKDGDTGEPGSKAYQAC
jgi:hypothetical protein